MNILDRIDAVTAASCPVCSTVLPDSCPSEFWCSEACQRTWNWQRADNPAGAYVPHLDRGDEYWPLPRGASGVQGARATLSIVDETASFYNRYYRSGGDHVLSDEQVVAIARRMRAYFHGYLPVPAQDVLRRIMTE